MRPNELAKRCSAVRLRNVTIADLAGLDENTVGRAFKPQAKSRYDTITRIEEALTVEELRLRDYLLGLHPVGEGA